MKPQAAKGTHDILPDRIGSWLAVERTVRSVLGHAGAAEIRTPVFEHTDVFVKTAGESSDLVVQKEMYTFSDRGGRSLTLRPEFTPGILRAWIQHGMHTLPAPVKLWSMGPAFRAENVQRGRFRQFHQVNFEAVGLDTPLLDAEVIALLYDVFARLGLRGHVVKVGSVGDPEDRAAYNAYLRSELEPRAAELTEVSQERLRLNPMRLLDAKDQGDRKLIDALKRPVDFLGDAARAHFEAVQAYLRAWDIPFEIDGAIVRGLDYYRRTAFEIHHGAIGAQSALCGGGRYDGLVESMGGPPAPGIGWAFGVERVLDAMAEDGVTAPEPETPLVYLVPLDDEAVPEVAATARELRRAIGAGFSYARRNPARGLKEADRAGARFAALRGERERSEGAWQVKDLASGAQESVAETLLADWLLERGGGA